MPEPGNRARSDAVLDSSKNFPSSGEFFRREPAKDQIAGIAHFSSVRLSHTENQHTDYNRDGVNCGDFHWGKYLDIDKAIPMPPDSWENPL
jgi:hypothetical protein